MYFIVDTILYPWDKLHYIESAQYRKMCVKKRSFHIMLYLASSEYNVDSKNFVELLSTILKKFNALCVLKNFDESNVLKYDTSICYYCKKLIQFSINLVKKMSLISYTECK